jgi:hypothetical protein
MYNDEIILAIKQEPVVIEENLKKKSEFGLEDKLSTTNNCCNKMTSEDTKYIFDKFYTELTVTQNLKQKELYDVNCKLR